MSQNTELLHGYYKPDTVLGTGGFSTVYHAVNTQTGQECSIKEFTAEHMDSIATVLRANAYSVASQSEPQPVEDPSNLSGEEKLSRGLMQVRHEAEMLELFGDIPGVPEYVETFRENNTFYLVKEYLEGMTCRDYMNRFRGRIPFTLALYIMKGDTGDPERDPCQRLYPLRYQSHQQLFVPRRRHLPDRLGQCRRP